MRQPLNKWFWKICLAPPPWWRPDNLYRRHVCLSTTWVLLVRGVRTGTILHEKGRHLGTRDNSVLHDFQQVSLQLRGLVTWGHGEHCNLSHQLRWRKRDLRRTQRFSEDDPWEKSLQKSIFGWTPLQQIFERNFSFANVWTKQAKHNVIDEPRLCGCSQMQTAQTVSEWDRHRHAGSCELVQCKTNWKPGRISFRRPANSSFGLRLN